MNQPTDREQFLFDFGPEQSHVARCIRCGFCNAVCPTSNVVSSFKDSRTSRGRVILLQSLAEGIGNVDPYSRDFKRLVDLCFACQRCVAVCPAGIPIPDLMSQARYAYLKRRGTIALTLGHLVFANYGVSDRLATKVAPVSNWMMRRSSVRKMMEWTTHIDSRARLPAFSGESFESWFRNRANASRTKKIVYFVDSYANFNYPSVAKTVVALLEHLDYQVIVPPQKESGMPAIEYGMLNKARSLARFNINELAPYAKVGRPVVCSSPAATYLLREGYRKILDDPEVATVSEAIVDMSELLLKEYESGNLHFIDGTQQNVIYHNCCLSKALSLGPTTTKLLDAASISYRQVDDCCGGAGVWGTFKENYEISSEIAGKLESKLEPTLTVLTESETCRLQLEAHTNATVRFPLELLAPNVKGLKR